ncbi:MAG TPA: hypothetical protein VGL59_06800 [Polyangia bacterium]|jgi:hypothetical protein
MAWFAMPKNAIQGDYGVVSAEDVRTKNLVPNSVWKVTVPVGASADIQFIDGGGLTLTSNAPTIVKNPIPETTAGNVRTLTLSGAAVGFTMVVASTSPGNGSLPLQVEVTESKPPTTLSKSIVLGQPSLALNAHDTPATYSMQYNRVVAPNTSAQEIITFIKSLGPLKHVAMSTHAFVSGGSTRLTIGTGFDSSNTGLFSQLDRQIGVLWLCGCAAAGSEQGSADCKARAMAAGCYVVAPVMFMSNPPGTKGVLHLAKGAIDMNARFMPVVFSPAGDKMSWGRFLGLGSRLAFKA